MKRLGRQMKGKMSQKMSRATLSDTVIGYQKKKKKLFKYWVRISKMEENFSLKRKKATVDSLKNEMS